jgi:hypothetical protein
MITTRTWHGTPEATTKCSETLQLISDSVPLSFGAHPVQVSPGVDQLFRPTLRLVVASGVLGRPAGGTPSPGDTRLFIVEESAGRDLLVQGIDG